MKRNELAAFRDLRKLLANQLASYLNWADGAKEKDDQEMVNYFSGKISGLSYALSLIDETLDKCDLPYEDDIDWLGK